MFCDYCDCDQCKFGTQVIELYHAKTKDDKWICNICYEFYKCPNGPCESFNCEHRPVIIGEWTIKKSYDEDCQSAKV